MKSMLTTAAALAVIGTALSVPAQAATSDFYTPPTSLPTQNGALVKNQSQQVTSALQDSSKATLIMYRSTDQTGSAVPVTGMYFEPKKAWSGSQRPLVALASGTIGQGDACAPSKSFVNAADLANGIAGYEIPAVKGLLDKGIAVVVTDYIGMGTPGVHTYVNRLDQGHALIDAARAASAVPGASVSASSPVGFYGYSQGGGAAASAAELASTYGQGLNVKGSYAGAPPADLYEVMKQVDGTSLAGVIGYAINGLVKYYPQLGTVLDQEVNATGRAALSKLSGQCIGATAVDFAFKKTGEWTVSGKPAAEIVPRYPAAKAAVEDQRLGTLRPSAPVLVTTGTQDDIVSHAQVKTMTQSWCDKGTTVTYKPNIQIFPSFGTGLNHITPLLTSMGDAQNWISDRLAGKSVSSDCGRLRWMP